MGRTDGVAALRGAVVGILDPSGGTRLGMGCLVTADLVVTCAHVLDNAKAAAVGAAFTVDFPLLAHPADPDHTYLVAIVEKCLDPKGNRDIALLRLKSAPTEARAAPLSTEQELWHHSFATFGFRAGQQDGAWHEGVLLEQQAAGWIQTRPATPADFRIEPGCSGAPAWDTVLGGVVGIVVATESVGPPGSYLIPILMLLDAWPDLRPVVTPSCPYKGLEPYREEDGAQFYGRGPQIEELAGRVRQSSIVVLFGPSGSGKSSLVHAGLIPRLRADQRAAVASFRPNNASSPYAALAAALLPLQQPDLDESDRQDALMALSKTVRTDGLANLVPRLLECSGAARLVIVLDQAEELLAPDSDDGNQLAGHLFTEPHPPGLHVVVTLRTDFLNAALARPAWEPLTRGAMVPIVAMSRSQLHDVIVKPVEGMPGISFERGLVERILSDVGTDPGALPLLGLTLTQLWPGPKGGGLTHQAYEAFGELSGSLKSYTREVWNGIADDDKDAARRLIRHLLRIPSTGPITRRVVVAADLGETDRRLAQWLAARRLLVIGRDSEARDTIELAHDALLDGWPVVEELITANREILAWQDGLREETDRWLTAKRDPDQLLRGTRLGLALRNQTNPAADLSEDERQFIHASKEQSRRSRYRRVAIGVGLAIAAAIAVVAVNEGIAAHRDSSDAASRTLAAAAANQLSSDPADAALLALAAYRQAPTAEAENALLGQYVRYRDIGQVPADGGAVFSGAPGNLKTAQISRDGTVTAGMTDNGLVTVWTRPAHGPVRQQQTTPAEQAETMGLSPDGTAVWLKRPQGLFRYDVATGDLRPVATLGPDEVNDSAVQVSADGGAVAWIVGTLDHSRLRVWDTATGQVLGDLPVGPLDSTYMFGPGRTLVVAGGPDLNSQTVRRWTPGGGPPTTITTAVNGIAIAPGSDTVAVCRNDSSNSASSQSGPPSTSFATFRVTDGAPLAQHSLSPASCSGFATDAQGQILASLATLSTPSPGDSVALDLKSGTAEPFVSPIRPASNDPTGQLTVGPALLPGPNGPRAAVFTRSQVALVPLPSSDHSVDNVQFRTLLPDGGTQAVVADNGATLAIAPTEGPDAVIARAPRPAPTWQSEPEDLTVDPRGSMIADRVAPDRIAIHQLPDLHTLAVIPTPPVLPPDSQGNGGTPHSQVFDAAGHVISVVGADVTVWDPVQSRPLAHLDLIARGLAAPGEMVAVRPGPDPSQLALVDWSRPDVHLIDLATEQEVNTIHVGADVLVASYDPSRRYVDILRHGGIIEVWDARDQRRVLGPLSASANSPNATGPPFVAKFNDGSGDFMIGTGSKVQEWAVGSAVPVRSLDLGPDQYVTDASADGQTLLTQTAEGDGYTISLRPSDWQNEVCSVVGDRSFSKAERDALPASVSAAPLCPGS